MININRKHVDHIITKTLAVILAGVFLFTSTLGWAKEEKLFSAGTENIALSSRLADDSKLAPKLGTTIDIVKEKFMAGEILASHTRTNSHIEDAFESGQAERTGVKLDIRSSKFCPKGVQLEFNEIELAKVQDLLKLGLYGHVGLGRALAKIDGEDEAQPTIYLDSEFYFDDDVRKHEADEIVQWEVLRNHLKLRPYQMRQWILDHFEVADKNLKGTKYEKIAPELTSIALAKKFHEKSHPLPQQLLKKGLRCVDFNTMFALYDETQKEKDVTIAAETSATGKRKRYASPELKEKVLKTLRGIDGKITVEGLAKRSTASISTIVGLGFRTLLKEENERRQRDEPGRSLLSLPPERVEDVQSALEAFLAQKEGNLTIGEIMKSTGAGYDSIIDHNYRQIIAEENERRIEAGQNRPLINLIKAPPRHPRPPPAHSNIWTEMIKERLKKVEGRFTISQLATAMGISEVILYQQKIRALVQKENEFRSTHESGRPVITMRKERPRDIPDRVKKVLKTAQGKITLAWLSKTAKTNTSTVGKYPFRDWIADENLERDRTGSQLLPIIPPDEHVTDPIGAMQEGFKKLEGKVSLKQIADISGISVPTTMRNNYRTYLLSENKRRLKEEPRRPLIRPPVNSGQDSAVALKEALQLVNGTITLSDITELAALPLRQLSSYQYRLLAVELVLQENLRRQKEESSRPIVILFEEKEIQNRKPPKADRKPKTPHRQILDNLREALKNVEGKISSPELAKKASISGSTLHHQNISELIAEENARRQEEEPGRPLVELDEETTSPEEAYNSLVAAVRQVEGKVGAGQIRKLAGVSSYWTTKYNLRELVAAENKRRQKEEPKRPLIDLNAAPTPHDVIIASLREGLKTLEGKITVRQAADVSNLPVTTVEHVDHDALANEENIRRSSEEPGRPPVIFRSMIKNGLRDTDAVLSPDDFLSLLKKEGLLGLACIVADQPEEFAAIFSSLLPEERISYEELLRSIWGFRQLNMAEVAMLHGFDIRHDRAGVLLDTFIQKAGLLSAVGTIEQQIFINAFLRYSYKQFSKNPARELKRFNKRLNNPDNPFLLRLKERVTEEFTKAINYKPLHMQGKLAPHETIGAYRLRNNNRFALLDGTRVGKTRQALAALNPDHRTLVISPASVIDTWLDEEGECFDPSLGYEYLSCDGSKADVREAAERARKKNGAGYLVVVLRGNPEDRIAMMNIIKGRNKVIIHVSMETLRDMPYEEFAILTENLDTSIIDEWQNVENYFAQDAPGAKQAAVIQKINSPVKWILSASPYRSDPGKLYSLFHYLLKDLPNAPEWAKDNNGRLFRRMFTEDLQGLRLLNGELSKISLRRSMQDVWDAYDPGKDPSDQPLSIPALVKIEPSQAGAFEISDKMAEAALHMIKNFRSYIANVYNPSVPEEDRFGKRKLNILIKLNFLRWLTVSCQSKRVGLNEDSRYWQELDELVTEKIKKGEKIILYAQNIFMVNELLERYKNYGCVRMDGDVTGWARNSDGSIVRGKFDENRRFIPGVGSIPITSKSWARHRFQEDNSVRICVANIRAGIGLDLSRADSIIYAQLPTTYVEFYQSVSRALGINPQHVRKSVEAIFMVAKYPKDVIDKYASSSDVRYLNAGTVDEIQLKRLAAQDKLFSMIIEGVDPSYLEKEEFYLLRHIPGFLEDPSLDIQGLTPRLRQAAETAMNLGALYAIATGQQQDAIRTIIHDGYDTKIDLRAVGDVIFGIDEFNPNDLIAISSISKSHNRLYKQKLFAVLPGILKRIYESGSSLSEYCTRWNGGEEVPGHIIVAWLAAIPKGEEPTLSSIIGTLVEQCMTSQSNKPYLFQLLGESLVNFQGQDLKLLDNQRDILVNRRVSLKNRLILLKKISEIAQLGGVSDEIQELLENKYSSFREMDEMISNLRFRLLEQLIKKDLNITVQAQTLKQLEGKWGSLDPILLFTANLKRGGEEAFNKEFGSMYERDIKRFGEILGHIVNDDFSDWRNKHKGNRQNGCEVTYLKDNENFWGNWANEESINLGNIAVAGQDLLKEAGQAISRLILQGDRAISDELLDTITRTDGEWVSDRIARLMVAEDRSSMYHTYEHEHKVLGTIYNRLFNGKALDPKEQEFLRTKIGLNPGMERSELMNALNIRLNEYKCLKEWLDVIIWANKPLSFAVEQVTKHLSRVLSRTRMIEDTSFVSNNLEEAASLLTVYKKEERAYKDVEVIVTSDPKLILIRGMLDPGLYNCFQLNGDPRIVRALIDDLGSRNKMFVIVKASGRYEAVAVAKIKQDKVGAPVIFLEKILHRKGGYNFQKEILGVLKREKSDKVAERPRLAVEAALGRKDITELQSTGGYGEDEYSEAHHKLRKINHFNKNGTMSSYSYPTKSTIVKDLDETIQGSCAECLETIKENETLLHNAMDKHEGIRVGEVAKYRYRIEEEKKIYYDPRTVRKEFEILKDLGIFVPVEGKRGYYRFADMMIGPKKDEGYTKALINVVNEVNFKVGTYKKDQPPLQRGNIPEVERPLVKEILKLHIANYIHTNMEKAQIIDKSYIIKAWKGYGAPSQQSLLTELRKMTEDKPYQVSFEKIEDLVEFACNSENINDRTVIMLPYDKLSESQIARLQESKAKVIYINLDGKLSADDLTPLESLIAIGRAYLVNDEIAFYRLYGLLTQEKNYIQISLETLKNNPLLFINALRFILKPITAHDPRELDRIKERMKALLIAA